jgi:hypothetical protein
MNKSFVLLLISTENAINNVDLARPIGVLFMETTVVDGVGDDDDDDDDGSATITIAPSVAPLSTTGPTSEGVSFLKNVYFDSVGIASIVALVLCLMW